MVGQTLKNCQLNSGRGNAHLSNGSWTNNRTDTTWTTYGGISNNGKALGLPSTSVNPSKITFTVQIDSGYAMNVKSFSFYDRSSNTGFKNWSMTINGITVGTDTTFVDCSGCSNAVRPTGTIAVTSPVNVTGTATFELTLSNKGTGSSGTFRIDSFIVNGNINPIYDITGSSVYANKVYKYSFNGQEREQEIGSSFTTAEFWMYDGRIGRRWNVDPKAIKYPYESPFATFHNAPIRFADPNGDDSGNDVYTQPNASTNQSDLNKEKNLADENKKLVAEYLKKPAEQREKDELANFTTIYYLGASQKKEGKMSADILYNHFVKGNGSQINFTNESGIANVISQSDEFKNMANVYEQKAMEYYKANGSLEGFKGNDLLKDIHPQYMGGITNSTNIYLYAVMGGYKSINAVVTEISSTKISVNYTFTDHFGAGADDSKSTKWVFFPIPGLRSQYLLQHYEGKSNDPNDKNTYQPFIWTVTISRTKTQ